MTQNELAYLAGVFDMAIGLKITKSTKPHRKYVFYSAMLECVTYNYNYAVFIKDLFGLRLSSRIIVYKEKEKTCYRVACFDKCHIKYLINLVLKFLIRKKTQALCLLEFINSSHNSVGEFFRPKIIALGLKERNDIKLLGKVEGCTASTSFWAYFAGVLDSDGRFQIFFKKARSRKSDEYGAEIVFRVTGAAIFNFIRRNAFYGFVNGNRRKGEKIRYFQFRIGNRISVILVLRKIIGFLRFRKRSAEFLLNYCKSVKPCAKNVLGLDQEELKYRKDSFDKLKKLNLFKEEI